MADGETNRNVVVGGAYAFVAFVGVVFVALTALVLVAGFVGAPADDATGGATAPDDPAADGALAGTTPPGPRPASRCGSRTPGSGAAR